MALRIGLRAQIGLVLLAVATVAVALVALPVHNLLERTLAEERVMGARRVCQLLAGQIEAAAAHAPAITNGSAHTLELEARQALEVGLLDRLELYDAAGNALLVLPPGRPLPRQSTALALDEERAEVRDEALLGVPMVRIERGVALGNIHGIGVLVVISSLDTAITRLETGRFLTALYAVLAAGVVLLIGYAAFSRLVVAPVRRIGLATRRVAAGDHASRLDVRSDNELGDLAGSINDMLDKLDAGRSALEGQVKALEGAREELLRAQAAVIRGERLASVGRLAAGVAHEVGNPLAALLGLVELMRDDPEMPVADRADILARLERELLRIHETIRGLLDYSRTGDEGIAAADVGEVVDQARRLVEAQPPFREVTMAVDVAERLPAIRANADRFLQVMVNLLMNAADALNGRGRIEIGATAAGDGRGVVVRVSDSGPGVAPEVLEHLFEPFFTTKPPGQGTGLGLAICESIVQGFGGRIEVDGGGGETGRGATFSVWVPTARAQGEQETGDRQPATGNRQPRVSDE